MPSFQNLPAEILLMIAQYVGGAYLRGRADRILLCKTWYSITQSIAWEAVAISIDSLEGYLQAPPDAQSFTQTRIKDLSISGPCDSIVTTTSPQTLESGREESWRAAELRSLLQARNNTLCTTLTTFSSTLPKMRKLNSFILRLSTESTIYVEAKSNWTDTIRTLITSLPKTLTSLTIDKLGPTSKYSTGVTDPHTTCKVILTKDALPALKHLRIRTHCICPSLFDVEAIESHANLETFVLALDAYSPQLGMVFGTYCCTQPQLSNRLLFDVVVDAGKKAFEAGCFKKMRVGRILRYDLQRLRFCAFDMVSEKTLDVPHGVEWDDVDWERREEVHAGGVDGIVSLAGAQGTTGMPNLSAALAPFQTTLSINLATHV